MKNPTLKLALLGATFLATALTASAQGPTVALKVGANLSNFHKSEVNDNNARFGFDAGIMGRTSPDNAIGLQAELLYTTRGTKTDYSAFGNLVNQTVDFRLGYIQLPLMVSFRFGKSAFEIQAGAYAAYLVSADVKSTGDLGNGSESLDKDNFNTIDAGLVGGIAFNPGPLQVGLRYDYGMTKVANSDTAKLLLGNAENSCVQLYVAIGI